MKITFTTYFLPFGQTFITHPDTLKKLVEEVEYNEKGEEIVTKKGIQLGEFLEFFGRLFDSKQLHNFTGKYEKPNKPTVEEMMPAITEALDVRLKEIKEQLIQTNEEMRDQKQNYARSLDNNFDRVAMLLTEICKKVG